MRRLSWRYAIRNTLYYRTKYATAFFLICGFAFALALSLFAFNGFWAQAGAYARSWGDMTFYTNPGRIDEQATIRGGAGEGSPYRRIEALLPAFFEKELKAVKQVAASFIGGNAYYKSGTCDLTLMDMEKAAGLWGVEIAEGEAPGEGEALLPSRLRGSLSVGDSLTFVYKNRDSIYNSVLIRVSGFFLPAGRHADFLYVNPAQFSAFDEGRPNDIFFVFLAEGGEGRNFPSQSEYKAAFESFKRLIAETAGPRSAEQVGYETARSRYSSSKQIIEFFELIVLIFLSAFVIVAIATIVNVLFITLIDRIRIVGTFMAFGMKRRRAVLLLSSEILAFSLAACAIGVLAALAATAPLSSLRFTADNWTIAVILGGKRHLTILPAFWAVAATFAAGSGIPFAVAALSAAKMLKGEVVRLLHYAK